MVVAWMQTHSTVVEFAVLSPLGAEKEAESEVGLVMLQRYTSTAMSAVLIVERNANHGARPELSLQSMVQLTANVPMHVGHTRDGVPDPQRSNTGSRANPARTNIVQHPTNVALRAQTEVSQPGPLKGRFLGWSSGSTRPKLRA